MLFKPKKLMRVTYSYMRNKFIPTPVFLRLIPTDRCNLSCKYCFQHDNKSHIMTKEEFDSYFNKAIELGAGIVSFLGGEPMIWPHIYYAIQKCTDKGIMTEMTTNATLLSDKNLQKLGVAGLDMLNLSVDSLTQANQSNKNLLTKNDLAHRLKLFRKKYKTHVRLNVVITKPNIKDIEKLLDFAHELNYPLSLGFVVPPFFKKGGFEGNNLLFAKSDFQILRKTVKMILDKKRQGYNIIDPDSYFKGIFDFINGTNDWDCSYGKERYAGVTIAPDGRLRSCGKLMDYLDYKFLELTPKKIKEVRKDLGKKIKWCNPLCYSNCCFSERFFLTGFKINSLFCFLAIKLIYSAV